MNAARLEHPAIADGENSFLLAEGNLCLMRRETAGESCLIAVNFSAKEPGRIEVGPCAIAADLETGAEGASLEKADGTTWLSLPPYGIAVLLPGD